MAKYNRDSLSDTKVLVEKFLPNKESREKFIRFLANAINFADTIKNDNWCLNLDKDGHFLRFNVGQEYCIQLTDYELLILCDRTTIKPIIEKEKIPILFRGHRHHQRIENADIDKVPDCLAKTKNSIGCLIDIENISEYIDFFIQSNKDFIRAAMNTCLMPIMRRAHSNGAVDYVFTEFSTNNEIKNNIHQYNIDYSDIQQDFEEKVRKAQKLSDKQLEAKLNKTQTNSTPTKIIAQRPVYRRNEYVTESVLRRANGICEKCGRPAPFLRDKDNTPFLEVHHKIPLSEEGYDTMENAIALCPNCHRHAHSGKNTY
jgi:hypothetical protein